MPKRSSKDTNQMAFEIIRAATGGQPDSPPESDKNPAAVALGRLGGLKGGKARAKSLTHAKRVRIAKKAAQARWAKR